MGEETKESAIQWHPAFYAGIQIEFSQEKEKLKVVHLLIIFKV